MNKVDDIQNFWKWWSVQLAVLSTVFSAITLAYMGLPPDWLPGIPQWAKTALAVGSLVTAGGAAWVRGISQPNLQR